MMVDPLIIPIVRPIMGWLLAPHCFRHLTLSCHPHGIILPAD